MPAPLELIDPRICPLCGQPNVCAQALAHSTGQLQPPCWCLALEIPPSVLAAIPLPSVNRACICPACAAPTP